MTALKLMGENDMRKILHFRAWHSLPLIWKSYFWPAPFTLTVWFNRTWLLCLFSKPEWLFLGISRIDASCLIQSGNLYTYHTKMYLINLSPSHFTILQTTGVQLMHRVSPRSHLNYIKALKVFKNCFRFMALSWRGNFEDKRDWFWPNIEQKPLLSLSLYFQWKCHIILY